jgi:hypothetical protein
MEGPRAPAVPLCIKGQPQRHTLQLRLCQERPELRDISAVTRQRRSKLIGYGRVEFLGSLQEELSSS